MAKDINFPIVGIGASAGGLDALKIFFNNLKPDTGMAFVIVQHHDPKFKSLLSQILKNHTKLPVTAVSKEVIPKPNNIYLAISESDLVLDVNTLKLLPSPKRIAQRKPIDLFFNSLADSLSNNAIAVILSGNGSDGSAGLANINKQGGSIFVQDPSTAKFSGMPESAINTGFADFILSPVKIATKLNKFFVNTIKQHSNNHQNIVINDAKLLQILQVVKDTTFIDFLDYKPSTIVRRISKRVLLTKSKSIDEYIHKLKKSPDEVNRLYNDFLIGVTTFFRDKNVFNFIEKNCIPFVVNNCIDKQIIRVWVCGCSTGEEAYSYAILFKEYLTKANLQLKVMIFASDLSKHAIAFSRKGIYSKSISETISSDRLSKYFLFKDNHYKVRKEIRDMVIFSHHNVISDPPFSKIDLISCRNLLIYIKSKLQNKLLQKFSFSLCNEGILVLGLSESIGVQGLLFSPMEEKLKIYKKNINILTKINPVYDFFNERQHTLTGNLLSNNSSMKKSNISDITKKILLDQYAPPSVIIDKNNDALYFSGDTGIYLEPPAGVAKFNILEMARKGLKVPLQQAIDESRKSNKEVYTKDIDVILVDSLKKTNLKVRPLLTKEYDPGMLIIIFEPSENISHTNQLVSKTLSKKEEIKFKLLEKELELTNQHLQIAINEIENTREEFKYSTEELQSSNEELETSREELQAVNEEFITVNAELTEKIDQMYQSNDDLTNLLRCIELATLYLDKDLLIKRFTPAVTKIFNIISTDIDRPLTQLTSNLKYTTLVDDVTQVLKTLSVKSLEVNALDGTWYFMRIIPYRTAENSIEGVLITLIDITKQKQAEFQINMAEALLNTINKNLSVVTYTAKLQPEFIFENLSLNIEKLLGFPADKFIHNNSFFMNRMLLEDKAKFLQMVNDLPTGKGKHLKFSWKTKGNILKELIIYSNCILSDDSKLPYCIGFLKEV
jgi:two-component system CheB/CheR fusion protein